MDEASLSRRVDQLLQDAARVRRGEYGAVDVIPANTVFQSTCSVVIAAYSAGSLQGKHFADLAAGAASGKNFPGSRLDSSIAQLQALRTEIDTGFRGQLEARISGGVLADLTGLARETLRDGRDAAHTNVAAVLTAAAFEDTLRRMGSLLAGVTNERPKLEAVITALRDADVLPPAQVRVAVSGLGFHNDALHADWEKIDRPSVEQYLALVEGWLAEHFR